MKKLTIIFNTALILLMFEAIKCFVPAKIIDTLVEKLDSTSRINLGIVSKSLSHEDITRRGLIRSVARYLYDQPGGRDRIQLGNIERYFNNINFLYSDFNKKSSIIPILELEFLLKTEILPYVAFVDLDPSTRDLPYAHFDAEKLIESNVRVIEMTTRTNSAILSGNLAQARHLAAQVLHTIQDFYSHSNWIEMGNRNINTGIGSIEFERQARVGSGDRNLCLSNCQLVRIECANGLKRLANVLRTIKSATSRVIKCPIEYYKCDKGNIGVLNKLLSGFYTTQKLSDGTSVVNPGGLMKCNHGGLLDTDSVRQSAQGGINKDAGVYALSPHAHLHLEAARLAELHTEYFFNSIRSKVGDRVFAEFLKINKKVF